MLGSVIANAYERGDIAYVCDKDDKFLWVDGSDSWTSCPVRILEKSGGSYKVLALEYCIIEGVSSAIPRNQEDWIESYHLWSSASSCENQ